MVMMMRVRMKRRYAWAAEDTFEADRQTPVVVVLEVDESGEEEAEEGTVLGEERLGGLGAEVEQRVGQPDLEEPDQTQARHHRHDPQGLQEFNQVQVGLDDAHRL